MVSCHIGFTFSECHLTVGWVQVSKLLQYAPSKRYGALEAMTHPFFDELRDPATLLPNGKALLSLQVRFAQSEA